MPSSKKTVVSYLWLKTWWFGNSWCFFLAGQMVLLLLKWNWRQCAEVWRSRWVLFWRLNQLLWIFFVCSECWITINSHVTIFLDLFHLHRRNWKQWQLIFRSVY